MIQHQGIYLPDGENHLQGWMTANGEIVDGRGTYQIKKLRAAISYCTSFRGAIDVGAHVGTWSMQLAKRFAHVYAFEPMATHRECFALNVDAPNVTLYPVALGERAARVAMHTNPTSSGDTWVSGAGDVQMYALDSLELAEVDFVKLDCEGYELFALRGGEQMLKRWRPVVIVEQKPLRAQKFGLPETGAVDYLQGLGYTLAAEMAGDFIMTAGQVHEAD